MRRIRRSLVLLTSLALVSLGLAPLAPAFSVGPTVARAATAGCAARVAMLGVDMSPGGRFEVERALAVGPHTLQLDETLADERAEAHGLVPAGLLGVVAISSALLRPLPAGAGLTVRLNPAITLDTAETYANALLTAGIADADIGVAAPTSQRALGTTALLGLLRAARAACLPIDPARHDLAIREVVLTGELAQQIGRQAAPSLLSALKADAASQRLIAPRALTGLITHDAAAAGVTVPDASRPALLTFLHDLVASGAYARIAAAHPSVSVAGVVQATVRLGGAARAPAAPVAPAASAPQASSHAGLWKGVVVVTGGSRLTVRLPDGTHTYALAPPSRVYRNGQVSSLAALRPGDAVTVTANAAGLATLVQASHATGAAVTPPSAAAPALNAGAIAAAALLILLALLLAPLLVGWLRHRARAAAMAAPLHSGGSAGPFAVISRSISRAPVWRRRNRE